LRREIDRLLRPFSTLSKKLTKKLGGSLSLASKIGQGTTVTLRLPIVASAA
jgi:signal transduction histidine kinase